MAALAEPGARGSGWVGGETRKMRRCARRAGPWGAATHRQHPPRPLNRAPGPDGDDANVAALVDALADDASSDERRIAAAERLRDLLMDSAKAGRMGVDVGVGGKGWWAKLVGTALLTPARASPPTGAGATPSPSSPGPPGPGRPGPTRLVRDATQAQGRPSHSAGRVGVPGPGPGRRCRPAAGGWAGPGHAQRRTVFAGRRQPDFRTGPATARARRPDGGLFRALPRRASPGGRGGGPGAACRPSEQAVGVWGWRRGAQPFFTAAHPSITTNPCTLRPCWPRPRAWCV